jgi:hypothetical protein
MGDKFKRRTKHHEDQEEKEQKIFRSRIFTYREEKLLSSSKISFLKDCIQKFKDNIGFNLNCRWNKELTELLFYIIYNGSHLGGTGKSGYSEVQIKCKVKKKFIKNVLTKIWEWTNGESKMVSCNQFSGLLLKTLRPS